jgi:mannose-6-phosphate isomerase-like protein (cupin superfamily)
MDDGNAPAVVQSTAEMRAEFTRLSEKTTPTFAHLRARLPRSGRTNQVFAASERMSVLLKTYASGGENELHSHSNEDHVFIVLQGSAIFYGPEGEERRLSKNDCAFFPSGAIYRFLANEEDGPLVLVRVGAVVDPAQDVLARVDVTGGVMDGYSQENRRDELVFGDDWFE